MSSAGRHPAASPSPPRQGHPLGCIGSQPGSGATHPCVSPTQVLLTPPPPSLQLSLNRGTMSLREDQQQQDKDRVLRSPQGAPSVTAVRVHPGHCIRQGPESSRACGSLDGRASPRLREPWPSAPRDFTEVSEHLVSSQPLTHHPGFIPFPSSISLRKHTHGECPLTARYPTHVPSQGRPGW